MSDVFDGTHQTPRYKDNGVKFLSVENIKTLNSDKFISLEDFIEEFNSYPVKGDVLMTRIGDIGTANVVESDEKLAYYVSLALFKMHRDTDSYFLKNSIHSRSVQNELWKRTLHIAFPKKINKNEIEKVSIYIPRKNEQNRIGLFFEKIDKLITLHQRKLEQLEQLKNTLLSKMFPKSGTNIPEIRFSGFTDAWKQQRLGNISIMYQPETITSSELHNSGYPVFGANGYIGYFSKYNHKTDQVIISARGEKTGTANFVQGPIWITGNSMVINLDNSGVNKYFLYSNIKSFSLKKYITGGAQPQLTRDVLMKVPIVIPKINEQNNISKIFIKLDNYITIHQRKLEQLKNLKQTLLNKMFI